jgi:hypothetical protein
MTDTPFFRLLDVPVDDKGAALRARVAALHGEPCPPQAVDLDETGDTFTVDPRDFRAIPKSPFAYWVGPSIRRLFKELPSVEERGISVQHGASTKHDFRFLRLWWEVSSDSIGRTAEETHAGKPWVHFAKGGAYSPYYADVHLVVNWRNQAEEIETYVLNRYPYLKGNASWILHPENDYFEPGLTWTLRTQKGLSFRSLPKGCVFGSKGPAFFVQERDLLAIFLALMNSRCFRMLVDVQMAFGSYEIGTIQRTPIVTRMSDFGEILQLLSLEAHNLQRDGDRGDEVTHAFGMPDLLRHRAAPTLQAAEAALQGELRARAARLEAIQAEINALAFELYELDAADRALVRAEVEQPPVAATYAYQADLEARVQDLLMWCVGVAFGRWDVRKALDPGLLPPLGGPFDPLPRCAPAALEGPLTIDDLRLTTGEVDEAHDGVETKNRKSKIINPKSLLVDDPTNPADIVTQVRGVLRLLWEARADAIEAEICEILGVAALRDYFRDPRQGFFDYHARRYSKSRRQAPIYWLLQSERRNYAIWLYYPRLETRTLYTAGRDYADVKINLERGHLEPLQQALAGLEGSARRQQEREIARQLALIEEVTAFRDTLDRIALQDLTFDLNDGVLLNIAPLHPLVPWRYADRTWKELLKGKHAWSAMAHQLRARGLVKTAS